MRAANADALAALLLCCLCCPCGAAQRHVAGAGRTLALCQVEAPPAAPAKPSSFAPHRPARSHTYGVPIQPAIVKSHPRSKPHPVPNPAG